MSKGIIIQARYSASRLSGKLLLPFYKGKNILDIILKNISNYAETKRIPVVLATSKNPADNMIVRHTEKYPLVKIFRGSENNVLDRFIQAAHCFDITEIIRVCADNPFLNISFADDYFKSAENQNFDYISYYINEESPVIKSHFGFWPEYVKLSALESILDCSHEPKHTEHVTIYLYENPVKYKIGKLFVNSNLKDIQNVRLTVDTLSDFEVAQDVYSNLITLQKKVAPKNILSFVTNNEKILNKMSNNIKKNTK